MATIRAQFGMSTRIQALNERIEAAARRSGRNLEAVQLLAATKTIPAERIREAAQAGIRVMGENRVQEAAEKVPALQDLGVEWHFIGHLQSNKARQATRLFSTIQSVDTIELAQTLARVAHEQEKRVQALLEVNTSGEPSKHGFVPSEVERAVVEIQAFADIELRGLMTVGPLTDDTAQMREAFRLLKRLQNRLAARYTDTDWEILSMGMTDDFEIAVEEGSTLVRVGRAIFGPRS